MRFNHKWARRSLVITTATASIGLAMALPASAANPPVYPGADSCYPTHCYSRAVDIHSNIKAAQVNIQSVWMSLLDQTAPGYQSPVVNYGCAGGNCGWFITHELWLGNGSDWIEVGIMNGWESPQMHFADGRPGCNCQAYFTYWEDGPGDENSHRHLIANTTPDNSWHQYGIRPGARPGSFDITIDSRVIGTSTALGVSSFDRSAIGSESNTYSTMQPIANLNYSCETGWSVEDTANRWFGIGNPNQGVRGPLDDSGGQSQTYYGGWNSSQHALCIGKGNI